MILARGSGRHSWLASRAEASRPPFGPVGGVFRLPKSTSIPVGLEVARPPSLDGTGQHEAGTLAFMSSLPLQSLTPVAGGRI